MHAKAPRARRWLVQYPRAIPLAIFLAIIAITALSVFAIESNARARERAQMSEYAQGVAASLERSGTSFASYLGAAAALFGSLGEVRSQTFEAFAEALGLKTGYPGAQGIGWIPVIEARALPAFLAEVRRRQPDFPDIRPAPARGNARIAPVTLFAPATPENRRALGLDMYADPARAAAMAEAELAQRPTASGRIVLEHEEGGNAPSFAIYMPVFRQPAADRGDERQLIGFVYSPFRAEAFLAAAMDRAPPLPLGVRLYDGEAGTEHLLVAHSLPDAGAARVAQRVRIANRELMLVVEAADPQLLSPLSMVTLVFGLALASLLMLLVRLLTRQAVEDRARLAFFEEQHSIRNALSRELNHRVKNTLANVLSILSLTRRRSASLEEFGDSLEGRIRALSATHDLLTGSDWGTTPIRAVMEAELRHVRDGGETEIVLDGPPLELAPNDALTFGLAIHELATNAAKYGSLSVPGGALAVRWRMIADHLAEVEWVESGGPPVSGERRRGFGTELIEKIVAHELRQPVALDFRPEGVRCAMRVAIRRRADFRIRENEGGRATKR